MRMEERPLNLSTGNVLRGALCLLAFAAPLVYLPGATISFELAKWAVIKTFAGFFLFAGVIHLITGQASPAIKRLAREPLVWLAGAFAISSILSTVFAHARPTAIWGTATQDAGILSQLSLVILFVSTAVLIQTPRQHKQLLGCILASGVLMCGFCLSQLINEGAIGSERGEGRRVWGTIGNPIYLGDYLVMLIPLALGLALTIRKRIAIALPCILLGLALLWMLSASSARGASLGLLGATGFVVLAVLIRRAKQPKPYRIAMTLGTLAFVILFFLPSPISPLHIGGKAFHQRVGASMDARIQFWRASARMVGGYTQLDTREIYAGESAAVRVLCGWGPENLGAVIDPYLPPEAGVAANFIRTLSRAHNESWDRLLMYGVLGAFVYHGWIAIVLAAALRRLGWVHNRREARILAGTFALGQGVALAWLGISQAWPYWGLISILALLISSLVFMVYRPRGETDTPILAAAILAALIAHVAANQTGFEISATSLLAWLMAACLLPTHPPAPTSRPAILPGLALPLLLAAALAWFCFLPSIQAFLIAAEADQYDDEAGYGSAIEARALAIALRPERVSYYQAQATSLIDDALRRKKVADKDQGLREAEAMLQEAIRRQPYRSDPHADLARLYTLRYFLESDPLMRTAYAERVQASYRKAVALRPNDRYIWIEWAATSGRTGSQPGQVLAALDQPALMETFWKPVLHADILLHIGQEADAAEQARLFQEALAVLESLAIPDDRPTLIAEARLVHASLLFGLGRFDEAAAITARIRPKHIGGYVRVMSLDARILYKRGKVEEAREMAMKILKRTPIKARAQIQESFKEFMGPTP
ncbi:MAG: hypothetical protein ACI97B_000747 [Verrucomicrobiales bacterium]|jgi:hypothetical protein